MGDVTVTQFAEEVNVPVERLLSQLGEAGISAKQANDLISDDDKMALLSFMRRKHGGEGDNAQPKKIVLRRKSQSELRLASNQGRTRTVNVEVRKKRTYINREVLQQQAQAEQDKLREEAQKAQNEIDAAEREQQQKVDEERMQREAEEARLRNAAEAEEAERLKAAEDAERQAEQQREQAEQDARRAQELARKQAEAEARKREDEKRQQQQQKQKRAQPGGQRKGQGQQLHVSQGAGGKRRKKKARRRPVSVSVGTQHGFERPTEPLVREVAIPETITVGELAQRMAVKAAEVIRQLMGMGTMATINQSLDQDTAVLVVEEMGHTAKLIREDQIEDQVIEAAAQGGGEQVSRPPVVTIMGHVDHGKTSLLDYIRRTKVTEGEAGGITQHIGAYHVETDKGVVSFLDTPGHAAFTAMRARGAQVTDIVILVVAADDGVMPQTVEAVQHAAAAQVPVIVAVNKMDKAEADPERVKQELSQHNVIPEDWGGETQFVPVSALTGDGVDALLEAILLQAEVLELKAVTDGPASGVVIESSLEKGRGAVATVLVSRGTLRQGDAILAGQEFGRVRAMFDEAGQPLKEATPSYPAVVLGLSGTPNAGDDFNVLEDERKAREVAEYRADKQRDSKLKRKAAASLDDFMNRMADGDVSKLAVVIKADVQGSAEALGEALTSLSNDEVAVNVVSNGVGGINESDVNLAAASNAVMIGFNVRADGSARNAIKDKGVELRYHSVIYEVIDQVKAALSGMLSPEIKEEIVGLAEVRDVFRSPKFGNVAGCMITEGYVKRNLPIRVLRDNVVIYEGELESLRRFKDDVTDVRSGTECGIGVRNYNDVKPGDQIECFERKEVARTL